MVHPDIVRVYRKKRVSVRIILPGLAVTSAPKFPSCRLRVLAPGRDRCRFRHDIGYQRSVGVAKIRTVTGIHPKELGTGGGAKDYERNEPDPPSSALSLHALLFPQFQPGHRRLPPKGELSVRHCSRPGIVGVTRSVWTTILVRLEPNGEEVGRITRRLVGSYVACVRTDLVFAQLSPPQLRHCRASGLLDPCE